MPENGEKIQTGSLSCGIVTTMDRSAIKQRLEAPAPTPTDISPPAPPTRPAAPARNRPVSRPLTPEERRRLMRRRQVEQVRERVADHQQTDRRFQHELRELRQTHDLRQVDDDVEDISTIYAWHAQEYDHKPKTALWYTTYAAALTVLCLGFALTGNLMATLSIGVIGAFVYYLVQQEAPTIHYRLMTEGVAFNDVIYHYQDLQAFNVIYEPGETQTVILRSKRALSPLLHMEIGDEADPVVIRDILLEFVPEDQELYEPLTDVFARRLGF